ncbi:MAG TPA: acetate--CoA ligase family protein [Humidesulfovibrio sp.]|uniref:acetate--CoA ligase family protein n=1 Tax=Humidesulfovibrio sp. TaxID=2910988 RepID=UPI002D10FF5B|nr:acetate--CoA ligase family protein [Humidesulfovibrio sp.]HWR02976.1 acetate--CoA ligase family protein [Humidesulfovibrio sp.]
MPDAPSLQALLSPASVAVVGASRSRGKVGGMVLANIVAAGYRGAIHPVNPAAAAAGESLAGFAPLASSSELPDGVDLAVVCLPRAQALAEVEILAGRGVRAAIVLAAGFRETGRQGFLAEQELTRIAAQTGMLLLGPNSLGLINTACNLNVSFAAGHPKPGGVSFFSQSGAMCVSVLDWAMGLGLGFSKFVSLGNKARLNEAHVLRALGDDPDTKVILGYCESVEDGQEFLAAAREVTAKKPVLMLKAGITPAGARAVSAHTGSASGSPAAYRAAFRQAGIIHVEEMSGLFALAQAFATQPLPSGPGLAVLTNAGGPGILAADACARTSLTLPRPAAATLERLTEALPGFASLYNPVDLLGDAGAERYRAALSILLADAQIRSLLVLFTPTAKSEPLKTARAIIEAAHGPDNAEGKPVAACFLGGAMVAPAREALLAAGIPCYDFPEVAVEAMDALHRQHCWLAGARAAACRLPLEGAASVVASGLPSGCDAPWDDEALNIIATAKAQGLLELGGVTALEAAHAAGLPVLTTGLARTSGEAVRLAGEIGLPVSLSLAVREGGAAGFGPATPFSRSEGARFSRLLDAEAVRRAFLTLTSRAARLRPDASVTGCLVQAAAHVPQSGFELVTGFTRDAQFGPLLSFGLAGIGSELLGEVSHRLAPVNPPLTPEDAREMLREMRFYPLLRGAGGGAVVSLAALERLLLAVARLALRAPGLSGAEFSPVLAGPEGVFIAGARLTLG